MQYQLAYMEGHIPNIYPTFFFLDKQKLVQVPGSLSLWFGLA